MEKSMLEKCKAREKLFTAHSNPLRDLIFFPAQTVSLVPSHNPIMITLTSSCAQTFIRNEKTESKIF